MAVSPLLKLLRFTCDSGSLGLGLPVFTQVSAPKPHLLSWGKSCSDLLKTTILF